MPVCVRCGWGQCSEAGVGDRGSRPPCRPAGKGSILSPLSDFLCSQVLGQPGDSRRLSLAAPVFPESFLWTRHCVKHHVCSHIYQPHCTGVETEAPAQRGQ